MWKLRYLILLAFSSCMATSESPSVVSFTFKNDTGHALDWVRLDGAGIDPIGGAMPAGSFKMTDGIRWKVDQNTKVTFVDDKTRERHTIALSFEEVTEKIKAGTCQNVTVTILAYDKAHVGCR